MPPENPQSPCPLENQNAAVDFKNIQIQMRQGKGSVLNRSTGYSTDVDQMARWKRHLELEGKWKKMVKNNEINEEKLNYIMLAKLKDNFK